MKTTTLKMTFPLSVSLLAMAPGCASGLKVGTMAPDFTLNNRTGQKVMLSQYRGKVVLLGFWAVG